jgi:hypothetical protein
MTSLQKLALRFAEVITPNQTNGTRYSTASLELVYDVLIWTKNNTVDLRRVLRRQFVKLWERDVMVIKVGTCNAGKLHEVIHTHLVSLVVLLHQVPVLL